MAKLLIEVIDGKFCWQNSAVKPICKYFNNPLGQPECKLGFDNSEEYVEGVLRPLECTDKEVK